MKPEDEMISDEEIDLYDYWRILVKRKNILIGVFFIPLVIVTIVSFSLPRYYRGQSEITIPVLLGTKEPNGKTEMTIPALPAPGLDSVITVPNIVRLIGNVDEAKKIIIFANNSSAIKSVVISIPKKTSDKIAVLVDAQKTGVIPQAFNDIVNFINMLPEIKEEIAQIETDTDLKSQWLIEQTDAKIEKLVEAKKANLIFLNQITEMMSKRQISIPYYNPSDLIIKDAALSLEAENLRQAKEGMMKKTLTAKMTAAKLGPLTITKHPSDKQIKQRIIITVIISLMVGIVLIFFLNYIERMKNARKYIKEPNRQNM
jgi:capsular polysaccharide biosynthesis protein